MTVSARPRDFAGAHLQTKVADLTAVLAALPAASASAKNAAAVELDLAQRELLYHYMSTGRLLAANILSTMT